MKQTVPLQYEKSLYVACALNGAEDEYRSQVDAVRDELEQKHGINVLRFLGLGAFSPLEVFWADIEMARNCSALLGIYGHASDGRGMETITALERGIPILGVANKTDIVSKMVLGAYEYHQQPFVRVDSLAEIPALVVERFVKIEKAL